MMDFVGRLAPEQAASDRSGMNRLFATLFICFSLAAGLALMAVTPIGEVADEAAHIMRADSIAHGFLIGHRLPSPSNGADAMEGIVLADRGVARVALDTAFRQHAVMTREAQNFAKALVWEHNLIPNEIGQLAGYMPIFYLPGAAALAVGRWLDVPPYLAVQTGRLANLLVFVSIGGLALLLARRGRGLLLCTLSVPLSLSLAASFNQDGLLIAAACLAAALASRAFDHAGNPQDIPGQPWFWAAALLVVLIGMVKPPYLALGALLLLPWPAGWRSRGVRRSFWQRVALLGLVCVPAILWLAFVTPLATGSVPRAAYEAGPLWSGVRPAIFHSTDAAAQLRVLLERPWLFITLPVRSLWPNANLWIEGVGVLGWLTVQLPHWMYRGWWFVLALAAAGDLLAASTAPSGRIRPNWQAALCEAALLALAAAAAIWAVYIAQYLTWTGVGFTRIDGPTGRYFLPVVPLLALALAVPLRHAPALHQAGRTLQWAPFIMVVAGLYILPRLLLQAYFLSG